MNVVEVDELLCMHIHRTILSTLLASSSIACHYDNTDEDFKIHFRVFLDIFSGYLCKLFRVFSQESFSSLCEVQYVFYERC